MDDHVEISPDPINQLTGLAHRLCHNRAYMSYVLAVYQEQERLSDGTLVAQLNATPLRLARLALCKRPDPGSNQFANQLRQIAVYAGIDVGQLANIVRQVDSLQRLSELSSAAAAPEGVAPQLQLSPGLLTAARDHPVTEEENPPAVDQDESPTD